MTLDIAALRALAEKATDGPWEAAEVIHDNELIANVIRTPDGFLPSVQQGDYATIDYTPEDAGFIAAARTALPEALEEIERLTKERDEAIKALGVRTNLAGWRRAITDRVAAQVTEDRCSACGGSGRRTVDRWTQLNGDDDFPCELCGATGLVMTSLVPASAVAGGK